VNDQATLSAHVRLVAAVAVAAATTIVASGCGGGGASPRQPTHQRELRHGRLRDGTGAVAAPSDAELPRGHAAGRARAAHRGRPARRGGAQAQDRLCDIAEAGHRRDRGRVRGPQRRRRPGPPAVLESTTDTYATGIQDLGDAIALDSSGASLGAAGTNTGRELRTAIADARGLTSRWLRSARGLAQVDRVAIPVWAQRG